MYLFIFYVLQGDWWQETMTISITGNITPFPPALRSLTRTYWKLVVFLALYLFDHTPNLLSDMAVCDVLWSSLCLLGVLPAWPKNTVNFKTKSAYCH